MAFINTGQAVMKLIIRLWHNPACWRQLLDAYGVAPHHLYDSPFIVVLRREPDRQDFTVQLSLRSFAST
jgi:hypothetical protein